MNDKELIAQLKKMESLKPNGEWLKANRQVLRAQIYNGREDCQELGFFAKFNLLAHRFSQPYAVAAIIVLFFAGSGALSSWMSKDAKPGEVLYTAKMISEKTKYTLTLNEDSKTKLNVEFAKERVDEMNDVLKTETKSENKVAILKDNFKKEVSQARERLAKNNPVVPKKANTPVASSKKPAATTARATSAAPQTNTNASFMTAADSKGLGGIDISVGETDNKKLEDVLKKESDNPVEILDKAQELFEKADYQGAKDALDKANELIQK
ncbi:MAG: DUF5667 domain-containing protein [Patescibacteria group bacterium]|nr:DUF5667 domain-containing protein [Patescibacteria group bacterium]